MNRRKKLFSRTICQAIIILKNNLKKYSCNYFYDFLLTQPKLLNSISSLKKYNVKGCNEENYEQSTSIQ
jgi:hypothetical protein